MADEKRKMEVEITATDKTKKAVGSARKGLNEIVKGVGLVGAAIGGLGLGLMVKNTLAAADSQVKFADRLGISVKALSGLQHAADITGVKTESLNMGLQRMTRRVSEAAGGTGEAVKALQELGLSAEDLATLSPDKQFEAIASAMESVESRSDKVRLAFKLFDSEGVALVNTLDLGAEGVKALVNEADELGISLDRIDAAKIEAANDAMVRAGASTQGMVNTLTVELAPMIAAIADKLTLASKESGGFKEQIISFTETGLVGAARLADAWRGWEFIFKGLRIGWLALQAGLLTGFEEVDNAITETINSGLSQINKLIEGVNNIPGVSVPLIDKIAKDETLAGMAEEARDSMNLAIDDLLKFAQEPLPSDRVKEWIAEVKAAAQIAAEEVAAVVESRISQGVISPATFVPDETADDGKAREALEKKLESLRVSLLAEREALSEDFELKKELLMTAEAEKIEIQGGYENASKQLTAQYQSELTRIEETEADRRMAKARQETQRKQQSLQAFANGVAQISQIMTLTADKNSRKDFERQKKAESASVVVNTAAAAVKAYNTAGGAWWGLPAMLFTIAQGAAQLSNINKQSFDSAATIGDTGGGGGTTFTPPEQPFPDPTDVNIAGVDQQLISGPTYHIEIHGNVMSADELARDLIEPLEQARLDGVESEL